MHESPDDAATIDLTAAAIDEAWLIREIEPTNLIFTWEEGPSPSASDVLTSLGACTPGGAKLVETIDPESPEVAWAIVVQVGARRMPLLVWAEPGRPLSPEDAVVIGVEHPTWLIGVETILDQDDPLADYSIIIHWLAKSFPASAMLDVNTQQWFPAASRQALFGDEGVEPRAETLWTIHVVSDESRSNCWLHTHGLHRCGRPELELLNVPGELAVAGCELINTIAEAMLDRPAPPPPGETWPIGVEFDITLTPGPMQSSRFPMAYTARWPIDPTISWKPTKVSEG